MKNAVLVVAFIVLALFSVIRTESYKDTREATICTQEYVPVCDTAGNMHSNMCTLTSSGAQYDGSKCYSHDTNECVTFPNKGCSEPNLLS